MAQKDSDYNRCPGCGTVIKKASKKCRKCAGKSGPSAGKKLPSDLEVIRQVNKTSAGKVAAQYGVSVSTIKSILLKYPKYKEMK